MCHFRFCIQRATFSETGNLLKYKTDTVDLKTRTVSIGRSWTRQVLSSVRVYGEQRDLTFFVYVKADGNEVFCCSWPRTKDGTHSRYHVAWFTILIWRLGDCQGFPVHIRTRIRLHTRKANEYAVQGTMLIHTDSTDYYAIIPNGWRGMSDNPKTYGIFESGKCSLKYIIVFTSHVAHCNIMLPKYCQSAVNLDCGYEFLRDFQRVYVDISFYVINTIEKCCFQQQCDSNIEITRNNQTRL